MAQDIFPSPYKGLLPYSESAEDALFFFGRERETKLITVNLTASKCTLLYGPSGVGKSSVLRAGVVYSLRQQALDNKLRRGQPGFAVTIFANWRDDPMPALIESVLEQLEVDRATLDLSADASVMETFQACRRHIGGDLLVILDQFEEYFLYNGTEDGEGTFASEFPRLVAQRDLGVNFLISMREDTLARLDRFRGRMPSLFENRLQLGRLVRDDARKAILGPVEEYNRRLPVGGQPVSIEPALVEEVLDQIEGSDLTPLDPTDDSGMRPPICSLSSRASGTRRCLQVRKSYAWRRLLALAVRHRFMSTHLDDAMAQLSYEEQETASRSSATWLRNPV